MREGEIVRATVCAVHEFGIEIKAEGLLGFIQPVEQSWVPESGAAHAAADIGDSIDVLVYSITDTRFFASIKRAHPELDPWRDPEKFRVGSHHEGTVTGVFDWGHKVEIERGVDGMIILNKYPGERHVGDTVKAEVVDMDPLLKRIELRPV